MFGKKPKQSGWSQEQVDRLRSNPKSASGVDQQMLFEIRGIRHQNAPRQCDRRVIVQFTDSEGELRELAIPFEQAMEQLLKGLLTIQAESGYLFAS